jgi:hypothetical protein
MPRTPVEAGVTVGTFSLLFTLVLSTARDLLGLGGAIVPALAMGVLASTVAAWVLRLRSRR